MKYQHALFAQLTLAASIWTLWLFYLGGAAALQVLTDNIAIALTMLLGSFVAGATSVGGGAVAFPIFTKVLHIDSQSALIFSLAIQSVGMTTASIMLLVSRVPLCKRVIFYSIASGGCGLLISLFFLRLHLATADIKYLFSLFSFFVAVALIFERLRNTRAKVLDPKTPRAITLMIGSFTGGLLSGVIGVGIDFILFTLMIFCWNYDFKKATATSVVVMAINAVIGFTAVLMTGDLFIEPISNYWLAAVPVVVFGAPLGALACKYFGKNTLLNFLLVLILVDVASTIHIIGINNKTIGFIILLLLAVLFWHLTKRKLKESA
ncbi:MAG: sulfite exporter TauE/SafE family protein [Cellvibrionaceae bacterium]|nr:sulfite exporter TauE/SafE family protein [Cellvibrionaceae bacterium]